jgi:hypothetical protein
MGKTQLEVDGIAGVVVNQLLLYITNQIKLMTTAHVITSPSPGCNTINCLHINFHKKTLYFK